MRVLHKHPFIFYCHQWKTKPFSSLPLWANERKRNLSNMLIKGNSYLLLLLNLPDIIEQSWKSVWTHKETVVKNLRGLSKAKNLWENTITLCNSVCKCLTKIKADNFSQDKKCRCCSNRWILRVIKILIWVWFFSVIHLLDANLEKPYNHSRVLLPCDTLLLQLLKLRFLFFVNCTILWSCWPELCCRSWVYLFWHPRSKNKHIAHIAKTQHSWVSAFPWGSVWMNDSEWYEPRFTVPYSVHQSTFYVTQQALLPTELSGLIRK